MRLSKAEIEASASPGAADPTAGPRLGSVNDVSGYAVHAADGDIGHVADLLIDDEAWTVRYLVIDTGSWWTGDKVLLVPGTVRELDVDQRWVASPSPGSRSRPARPTTRR